MLSNKKWLAFFHNNKNKQHLFDLFVTYSLPGIKTSWRRRNVPNETPNDVSMERRQDVSVVRLHGVLLERHNDVSKGRNNDAPSLRLHDVSNKS